MKLRAYQQDAINKTFALICEHVSVLNVMFTGGGKTVVFAHIIKRFLQENLGKRVMVIAERSKIVKQAQKTLGKILGCNVGIEMAEHRVNMNHDVFAPRVIVGTVQTQARGGDGLGRLGKFDPSGFGLLIIDECVVGDTVVDGKPIASRKIGDVIHTHCGYGTVTHVFRNPVHCLYRLTTRDGRCLIGTANHPVLTERGWVPLSLLTTNSILHTTTISKGNKREKKGLRRVWNHLCTAFVESEHGFKVFARTQDYSHEKKTENGNQKVRGLSQINHFHWQKIIPITSKTLSLFTRMQGGAVKNHNAKNPRQTWWRNYIIAKNERNAPTGSKGVSQPKAANKAITTVGTWWKRLWSYGPSEIARLCFRLAVRSGCLCRKKERRWISRLLQIGYWKRVIENWRRSRRDFASGGHLSATGYKERFISGITRVEGVEVLESGCGDEFGKVCPDGYVYNLEVSNGNTYFANGILVHNCHHAVAPQYRKLIDYYTTNPDLRIVGVTATPDRSDEKAMGQVFNAVACNYDIHFGVMEGWIVKPRTIMPTIRSLDISHVGSYCGDFKQDELAEELSKDKPMYEIAATAIRLCEDKKTIIFCVTVKQAERLTDIINQLKPDSARLVHGGTPEEERDVLYHDYAERRFQFLVNVGVAIEGFDDPGVEMIVDAAMTKSRARYTQKLGRMLRPAENIANALNEHADACARKQLIADSTKPCAVYVDLVGNSGRHKPIFVGDVLGGRYDDDVIVRARKKAEKAGERDESVDMEELLAKAAKEIEVNKRRQALRRANIKVRVKYTLEETDPFNIYDVRPVDRTGVSEYNTRKLNEKQIMFLTRQGVRDADKIPFRDAVRLLGRISADLKAGRASYRQLAALKRCGLPTKVPWTRASASVALDKAYGKTTKEETHERRTEQIESGHAVT